MPFMPISVPQCACAVEQLSFDRFVSVLETTSHTPTWRRSYCHPAGKLGRMDLST